MTFEHHKKKILRQILGVGNEMAAAADESENRSPISLAELGQRFARPLLVARRVGAVKDYAPSRGGEPIRADLPNVNRFRFHGRGEYYLRNC